MIRITQNALTKESTAAQAYHYVIAGEALVFQSKVASLQAFEQGEASLQFSQMLSAQHQVDLLSQENAKLQYSGLAQFNMANRQVRFWRRNGCAQIDIEGVPICHIDLQEEHIHLLNDAPFDDRLNLEVLTGPALVLLLAQKGLYCMHAGAVATAAGNVAFVAESGSGKSTLSAHIDSDWRQLADDISPLRLLGDASEISLMTDFPQLKLDGLSVVDANKSTSGLDYLVRIKPQESAEIEFHKMDRTDALLQIVRHTVAAKLFDKTAMRAHAKFAKKLSGMIPVIEVAYPRRLDRLPQLRDSIIEYLSELNSSTTDSG